MKKKILIYLLSALIPTVIFFICATINGYVPFGRELLNSYDSFTQYPGMLLEYANLLREGNIFYSWNAGLGFNFLGTITYYGMSPLNLFSLLATSSNYHIFIAIMTFIRFALLGTTMCFYLEKKNIRPLYVVLFSTIYALMGYTATYYYNYIWIDSVIMLPLVIHGLDKLIDENKPLFYIVTLTFTIIINYYIGYMICIFCLIWFLYRLVNIKEKKKAIKTFIISSLLSGLMGAVVILPSFFALMTGKAELYGTADYIGFSRNTTTFLYTLTTGSYQQTDQSYGPAQIYCTIMVFVLSIFFFFNKKFSKKEKIATLAVIIFFYLSFSFNLLNYAWHFFQRPIWWQSRFAFLFSFFLITLAVKTLTNIDKTDFKIKHRIILAILVIIGFLVGAYFKWDVLSSVQIYTYFYLGLSILIFLEMMFLLDKKGFMTMLLIFTSVELVISTFNSLKNNYRYISHTDYQYVKDEIPEIIDRLDEENDNFYRFELMNDFTSDDGLYFDFHGFNYFNSVRNIDVVELMDKLGIFVADQCHFELEEFDPVIMSLFNIKYLYGERLNYFQKIDTRLYETPYPLAIGFIANEDIASFEFKSDNAYQNREDVILALTGLEKDLYRVYTSSDLENEEINDSSYYKYSFTSDGHYLVMPSEESGFIIINGTQKSLSRNYVEIFEGDEVHIEFKYEFEHDKDDIYFALLDIVSYEEHMEVLNKTLMHAETYEDGHILSGTIDLEDDGYLYTSIEYEKGMRIYVDGKEMEPDIILGSLIGLKLESGSHEITIDYIPRGLIGGSAISLTSLLITVIYLQKRKKAL